MSAAQSKAARVSSEHRREAKRLFNQAHLAYRRGDYEEAILKWLQSYELSKEPLIFESIANAYERLGDYKAALEYLSRWREKAPRREHEALDTRIENLKRRVAEQDERERAKRDEEERRRRQEQERRRREEDAKKRAPQDVGGGENATMEIVGWTLVGVGGAAVITGVALDIAAAVQRPDESSVCTEQDERLLCRDDERENIALTNQLAIGGDITWIAGLVIAAGGGGILLWQALGSEQEQARLVPLVGPGGAGLGVTGSF